MWSLDLLLPRVLRNMDVRAQTLLGKLVIGAWIGGIGCLLVRGLFHFEERVAKLEALIYRFRDLAGDL
jgi:hypothetical protein